MSGLFLLQIALVSLLLAVIYQDFKSREVSLLILLAVILCTGIFGLSCLKPNLFFKYFAINLGFLVSQFVLVTIYFSLKKRAFQNITKSQIGWGDILILLGLCCYFSPVNFIVFYVLSLLFIFLIFGISQLVRKKTSMIPLAGALAIFVIIFQVVNVLIFHMDQYDDSHALALLN